MRSTPTLLLAASALLLAPACATQSAKPANPLHEIAAHHDARMQWWRDARFGMFIHWGLYAIPAGEWNGETGHAEWIRETAHIPVDEYSKFQKQFNPVKFDPDEWARMAEAAGMKYLVITSKHHDGFGLFDSAQTNWDVMNTPFQRDILKELSAACARKDVRFCTYHSIMDWHHPDYLPRRSWEGEMRPAAGADFGHFVDYLHKQVSEVISKYHPGVLWFDGEWENTWSHDLGRNLYALCRSLDPKLIVNNRVDVHRSGMAGMSDSPEAFGDFGTPEQEIPATGQPGVDWETCMTMNDHWGYNSHDTHWKSTQELIRMLCDIASKGGNFLLNIGPRADGTFPPEAVERLESIGRWMMVNGEAIYGTDASPLEVLSFGRCTQKSKGMETRLYLHVFDWPKDGVLVIPGIGNEAKGACLLASPGPSLSAVRRGDALVVALPAAMPDPICSIVVLDIAGKPIVYRAPEIHADSDIFIDALEVSMKASSDELEIRYTGDGTDPLATSTLYEHPLKLHSTKSLRARTFHHGKPVSPVASARYERVQPLPAYPGGKGQTEIIKFFPELAVDLYEGDWARLPDFAALGQPSAHPMLDTISLPPALKRERIALVIRGQIQVESTGVWVFALDSDDGSRLWIDGQKVVDNDGLHGTATKEGRVALEGGWHDLRVEWFNKTGGAELSLRCGEMGRPLSYVSALHLRHR